MKGIILILLCSICTIKLSSQGIYTYINFKKVILKCDSLIEMNDFKSADKLLSQYKVQDVPLDFKRSYYCNLTEINIFKLNKDIALNYFTNAVLLGTKRVYIDYLYKRYKNSGEVEIINLLNEKFPEIENKYNQKIDYSLVNICDKIYREDQSIRHYYSNAIKNKESKNIKDSILNCMSKCDELNIKTYDSIVNKNGWLFKSRTGHQLRNYHIIVAHAESKYRYKYVKTGFDLAKRNKIEWNEIIGMQTFAFTKSEIEFENIRYVENFIIGNKIDVKSDFNTFIYYCLFLELTDGGTYNGNPKRIKLYLNSSNVKERLEILKLIKKKIESFGEIGENVITISEKENFKNKITKGSIGIMFL
ncbi:MAG: hypothetical protein ACK50A_11235 [Sphingobacteriaceae bacterium]